MESQIITPILTWVHTHIRRLIVVCLISTMLVYISLRIFRDYTEIETYNFVSSQKNTNTSVKNSEKKLIASDFELLFGFNNQTDADLKPAEMPKTRLNLTLHGALESIQQQMESSAIIQGNNQEKLYQIGDTLPGGAVLSEVHADHVVLKRNGQFEILPFPDSDNNSNGYAPYQQKLHEVSAPLPKSDYTHQTDSNSLEDRMLKLKEQLQHANQGR